MEKLEKRKIQLEENLRNLKQTEEDLVAKKADIEGLIEIKKNNLEMFKKRSREIKKNLNEMRQKFLVLKHETKMYKKEKTREIKSAYTEMYKDILLNVASIQPAKSISAFKEFDKIQMLIGKNVFKKLGRRLNEWYEVEREDLKKHILKEMAGKMENKRQVHELIFYMKFLEKYEMYFSENVIVDFLYKRLEEGFEYHFMTNRESNRLDKPEWFLEFLLYKLNESKDFYDLYLNSKKDGKEDRAINVEFKDIILRSINLIDEKVNQILVSESKQKRNLFLHFATEIIKFQSQVFNSYNVYLDFSNIGQIIAKEQIEYVKEFINNLHEKKYLYWFSGYKELSRECILYIYKFQSLDSEFKMDYLIDIILDYSTVFLESLRYINREEIRVLCYLYSEFEEYKINLIDQENEIMFDSRLILEGVSKPNESLNGEDTKEDVTDVVLSSIEKISIFNHENIKLIQSLIVNDTSIAIRSIRNVVYSSPEVPRNFIVEVNNFLEDYKRCTSYKSLRKLVRQKIDDYIVQNILLKTKLDTDKYFEFVDFIKNLKDLFGGEEFKSEVAIKCIGCLFEGKESNSSLFQTVKNIYDKEELE